MSLSSFTFSLEGLSCENLNKIQNSYISRHVSQYTLSKKLQHRVVEQLIKYLDSDKFYFIQSDIQQMQKWFRTIFSDIRAENCASLEKLYNLFVQRMKERVEFARSLIAKKDFVLDTTVKLTLDSDERDFAQSRWQLGDFHKKYIQYELASIMSAEDDLKKSKEHLLGIYNRKLKTIMSWNPNPSKEQLQYCQKEDRKNRRTVKTCKYEKWYAIYLDSFAKALDPHSSYLSRYELEDFEINMKLSLEGVGASLSSQYGYTVVERLLPGGAAFLSKKIKRKDKIIAIGQTPDKMVSIFGWDLRDVVQMVRGKKGTPVYLKILRASKDGKKERFNVRLVRQKIHLKDSASNLILSKKVINGKERVIGVIRIPSFYGGGSISARSVAKDVRKLLKEAQEEHNVVGIVLDLSSNGGGVLSEAVDVTGLFLKNGNVVRQMVKMPDRRSTYYTLKDEDNRIDYAGPLVVLVDRSSASASEIVAGALKDYRRAIIVGGDHTFGKGSIQSVENIDRLGAIKTTIGLYYVPSGKSIQKMGISSDISFPSVMSIDEYGEKTLDYVLPRQHTSSFLTRFDKTEWDTVDPTMLQKLRVKSNLRVKKSDKFKKIIKDLAKLKKKIKDKNQISIATFLTDAKKRNEEAQDLEDEFVWDTKDPKFQKKYLERANISEALNIAWDIFEINHKRTASFVNKSAS